MSSLTIGSLRGSLLLIVILVMPLQAGAAADRAESVAPSGMSPEVPDDPPGLLPAKANPLARSESVLVQVGPYVSVQVNVDALGLNIVGDAANEPSITVNPTNPDNMAIGWRQFDTISSNFRQAGYAYTFDGGATWTYPGVLTPGWFRSDPVHYLLL